MEEKDLRSIESADVRKVDDNNAIDTNGLVEVKRYKKANNCICSKVVAGILAIALLVSGYYSYHCFKDHRDDSNKNLNGTESSQSVHTSQRASQGGKASQSVQASQGGQGGPSDQGGKNEYPSNPDVIESKWTTGDVDKTITFDYYDAAENKEKSLTKVDKAYIEEYMDYYGISYEDARVCYLQYGPLAVPTNDKTPQNQNNVEYKTYYVFDADDLASINALVSELGYTRNEAEKYYVNEIAPSLGKTLGTEIRMIK